MTSQNEPAGAWVRVSTGRQDEANQVPDIERHCAAHGYHIAKRYELNDKSASKGEQQAKQDEAIEDIREGKIKVLVCWHSDRVERRGPEALFRLLRQIKDAGGRIESTKEPLLGTEDLSGEAVTALGAVIAHQYSVHIGEQVKLSHERIRANKALVAGGTPWGYEIVGEKYNKTIVPTDLCREIAPQIFARCIDGDSCRTIAAWLDSIGVPTVRGGRWSEGSVHRIITNMTYAARRQNEGDIKPNGKPSLKNRQTIMTCKTVVKMDVWDRANEALRTRPKRGHGTVAKLQNRPLLANLKCAHCGGPMWRIMTGRAEQRKPYYRCFGSGPQRKGCGMMLPLAKLDQLIKAWVYLGQTIPYETRQWVEGKNWNDEISNVAQDMHEAINARRFTDIPILQAKLEDYERKNREEGTTGHYEKKTVLNEDGTVKTIAEHFAELDEQGKHDYLATFDIKVEKGIALNGAKGARLVIDDVDYGVLPYIDSTR